MNNLQIVVLIIGAPCILFGIYAVAVWNTLKPAPMRPFISDLIENQRFELELKMLMWQKEEEFKNRKQTEE